ncbi:Phosphatidylinositol N-acetylglucosaminyltransferase subunit H (Phosphatidylinositol-glycan biosynthesis class H protein) (PIG-H) [Durusdinium trenchii]|uniref:Phosphatidylinositol N-acetylglucosaminyltransferase subunit H (Phosphatidylinositol-glycan biosynthesis class H protein) (PIG-H) n=1 Tax=Durusdinium trenchii TaxID=1381693 RepID=A0ABP0RPI7_9DINO
MVQFHEEFSPGWAIFTVKLDHARAPSAYWRALHCLAGPVLFCGLGLWKLAVVLLLGAAVWIFPRDVAEEKLVCMKGLGLQLSSRNRSGKTTSDFVEMSEIEEIIIAEAVTYFDVFYYLVVELKGSDRTKVPFRTLRPPVAQQLRVLRVLRDMLGLDDAERSKTAWGGRGQSCVWEARWFQGVCQK